MTKTRSTLNGTEEQIAHLTCAFVWLDVERWYFLPRAISFIELIKISGRSEEKKPFSRYCFVKLICFYSEAQDAAPGFVFHNWNLTHYSLSVLFRYKFAQIHLNYLFEFISTLNNSSCTYCPLLLLSAKRIRRHEITSPWKMSVDFCWDTVGPTYKVNSQMSLIYVLFFTFIQLLKEY